MKHGKRRMRSILSAVRDLGGTGEAVARAFAESCNTGAIVDQQIEQVNS